MKQNNIYDNGFGNHLTRPMGLEVPPAAKPNFSGITPSSISSGAPDFQNVKTGTKTISLKPGNKIQQAIDTIYAEGGGKVFLNPGTYNETADIIMRTGVSLEGTNQVNTIIDFGGLAKQIQIIGSDAYSAGTASINVGSTALTGSGTTWTSAMVGRSVWLDGNWYTIAAFVSTTSLTLEVNYTSATGLGNIVNGAYVIATTVDGCVLRNLTVQNSSVALIKAQYAQFIILDFVWQFSGQYALDASYCLGIDTNEGYAQECQYGIRLDKVGSVSYFTSSVYNSTVGAGIILTNAYDSTFFNFAVSGNATNGISVTTGGNIEFKAFTMNDNGAKGVEFISGVNDCQIIGGAITGNASDGVKLTATSDRNVLSSVSSLDNGGYGMNIAAATCDDNLVMGNIFTGNSTGQFSDSGTTTKLRGCIGSIDIG
jgi:hypothetical protein